MSIFLSLTKWFKKNEETDIDSTATIEHKNEEIDIASSTQIEPKNAPKADFFRNYYSLVAEGARLKLLEVMFELNFFDLFENKSAVLESEIIETLKLTPLRAKKWLHLLSDEHFLIKTTINGQRAYQLAEAFKSIFANKNDWLTMQYFFATWNLVANQNLKEVLLGKETTSSFGWPPKTEKEVTWLEDWMADTASWTIICLLDQINFDVVNNVLDVGGGDGTIACALAEAYPHLKISVYNLPQSAKRAKEHIESKGLSDRIRVIEGDFLVDEAFPLGFDLILFARVMWDWGENTNKRLLKMAYQALEKDQYVAICEVFKNDNIDFCLALEYRHIFFDEFDDHLMKTSEEYRRMLEEIGFSTLSNKADETSSLSVLFAQKN